MKTVFHNSIRVKLFLSHFLAVFLVSGSIGTFFYTRSSQSLMHGLQERLRSTSAMVSRTLDASELLSIQAAEDVKTPAYLANLEKLRSFRRMNKDIAFLYIMRRINNRVVFVIDSDESERQALPGKEYTEVNPALLDGFTGIAVDDKIYQDEWGAFLSGYAPIQNGMGEYLVGMDMHADDVEAKFRELRVSGWISLSASIILALFFSRFLSRRFMTPIQILIERCNAIAKGRLDERIVIQTNDELEHLVQAFNSMSVSLASLERNRQQAFEDLRRARDELGIRVEQRTQDLKEVNERLSREIADRIRAEQALEVTALTDPLTGLHNRRAISDHLRHQAIQCEREKSEFALLLADLDSFKGINDTYGHGAGDQILMEMSSLFRRSVRGQDLVSRWGGDEFLFLLPKTDIRGGFLLAEKICRTVAEKTYSADGKEIRLSTSIGVSVYSPGHNLEDCIKAADQALYRAKAKGRNQVAAMDFGLTLPES